MEFRTCKLLGGIGALLVFLSMFMGYVDSFGVTRIIGIVLILVGLYGLANIYKAKSISINAVIGGVILIVSSIVGTVAVQKLAIGFLDMFPELNSDIAASPDVFSTIDFSALLDSLLEAIWALLTIYYVVVIFLIIAAFFIWRALNILADKSNKKLFATTGLIILIGAVFALIFIGVIILWIATLILAIAFLTLKEPSPTPTTIEEEVKANFCPNCNTHLTPDAVFCPNCGKQTQ